ncbi:MAG: hypothetical protein R3B70_29190 [Polyangiaceae bacterium]
MKTSRLSTEGRPRLVLVRGGLADAPTAESPDWTDFCHRIGWQSPAGEPDDDFEDRLLRRLTEGPSAYGNAARLPVLHDRHPVESGAWPASSALAAADLLAEPESSPAPWGQLTPAVEPAASPAVEPAAAPAVDPAASPALEPERRRAPWGRVGLAAAGMLAVAAAAALITAKVVSPSAPATAAAVPERAADRAQQAPLAPTSQCPSPTASDRAADPRAPSAEEPTNKPTPGPTPPPGHESAPRRARVASRSRVTPETDSAPDTAPVEATLATFRPASVSLAPVETSHLDIGAAAGSQAIARVDVPVAWRSAGDREGSAGWSNTSPDRAVLPAPDSVAVAPAAVRPSTHVWSAASDASTAPDRGRTASAAGNWALSPEGDRWLGATVTPTLPRGSAPASVGVMAQLDLGRAFDKL